MKLRERINNNTCKFTGNVYEDNNKIIVIKKDTSNYYDFSTNDEFIFKSIEEYENWKKGQDWIKKIEKISSFKKVPNKKGEKILKKNFVMVNDKGQLFECRLTDEDIVNLEKELKEKNKKYKIVYDDGCIFIFINN